MALTAFLTAGLAAQPKSPTAPVAPAPPPLKRIDPAPKPDEPREVLPDASPSAAVADTAPPSVSEGGEMLTPCPGGPTCPHHAAPPGRRLLGRGGQPGGIPATEASWLDHPLCFGVYAGVLNGNPLIDDWLNQKQGLVGGLRIGWDFDAYWGVEFRYGIGSCALDDSARAIAYERSLPAGDSRHVAYERLRYSDRSYYDLSWLYYPFGDEGRWRPYLLTGVGMGQVRFVDRIRNGYSESLVAVPIAAGIKFRCTERLALRAEFRDDIIFAGISGFNTLHDLTATGSLEIRFGGSRRVYWPWEPGGRSW